ncbi:MAG: nodulation protein NfeD [Actinomycetota bacterium]|nr:nodulation protein NfeD [Actinomycetota bacterium]
MTWSRLLLAALAVLGLAGLMAAPAGVAAPRTSETPTVLTARVDGPITPVIADYLTDGVQEAERGGHQALLVELDTPGGLDTSMRQIIQSFLGADVPVVVYVAPAGARAASAGALITFSAHVAAMTPGTTIGAATPVDLQGGEITDKVINDAAAFAESVAAQRDRNTGFAVDTVRQGRAVPATEAHKIGAIDLLADDRATLLAALDGRDVQLNRATTVTLRTAGATVVDHDLGWTRQLLGVLADPNLAFLFLSLGTLAVLYELASPGMGFGGITGAILLIFGFFALSVLPVNAAGLALLALAAALFAAELFAPGIGVAAAGGAVALLLAGLFMFQGPVGVSPAVLGPTAALVGGGSLLAGRLARRAHRTRPTTGAEALIGHQTVVSSTSGQTTGRVRLEGAWWTARTRGEPLHDGQQVRVVALEDLTLIVEPIGTKE